MNLSAKQRAQRFLADYESWECGTSNDGNACWFHKNFPELTIHVEDAESHIDHSQEWTCGEIRRDNNSSSYFAIYYHQTRLARIHWVSFDDQKKSMVAPEWEPVGKGRIYFYEKDSLKYAMQQFHAASCRKIDSSVSLRIGSLAEGQNGVAAIPEGTHEISIPVVSKEAVRAFCQERDHEGVPCPEFDNAEQYRIFLTNHFDFLKWHESR